MGKALNVVKGIGGVVISIGVGAVAANVIKATTPEDTKRIMKACMGVGSYVVSGLAAAAAVNEFESNVDQVSKIFKAFNKEEPIDVEFKDVEEEET